MINLKSLKTQVIIFLCCFAAYLYIREGSGLFITRLATAVFFTAGVEALIGYLQKRKFQLSESAAISGLIIGFVLSSDNPCWFFGIASLLAIGSKHFIRFRQRHIFNPAAFGIFLVVVIFHATTQWKGTYVWYVLAPAGLYFAYKIRKLELVFAYLVMALGLFMIQAVMQKSNIAGIFGYLSCFFVFIMLIEPRTTPTTGAGKIIFAAAVALLVFILTERGVRFDVELFSLLALNLTVPLLNLITKRRA